MVEFYRHGWVSLIYDLLPLIFVVETMNFFLSDILIFEVRRMCPLMRIFLSHSYELTAIHFLDGFGFD